MSGVLIKIESLLQDISDYLEADDFPLAMQLRDDVEDMLVELKRIIDDA